MLAIRRATGVRVSISLGKGGESGDGWAVVAATYPAVAKREDGSVVCRVLKVSLARELCSEDDEESRESAAAWRSGMGGLDLWRQ